MNAAGIAPPDPTADYNGLGMKLLVGGVAFVLTSTTLLAAQQAAQQVISGESVVPINYINIAGIGAAIATAIWIVRKWDERGRRTDAAERAAKRLARRLRKLDGVVDPIIEDEDLNDA